MFYRESNTHTSLLSVGWLLSEQSILRNMAGAAKTGGGSMLLKSSNKLAEVVSMKNEPIKDYTVKQY